MTKQSAAIFLILIVALIAIAKSFENKSIDPSHLNPLPIQDENNNDPSLIDTIEFHMNREKKTDTVRENLISDFSECGTPPRINQFEISEFAGYSLKYPCTAGGKGYSLTRKSEDGSTTKEYTLNLGVLLGDDKESVWRNSSDFNDGAIREGFKIILKSNMSPFISPIFGNLKDYTFYKSDNSSGLDIYFKTSNPRSIVAFIRDITDASGHPPGVHCYLDENDTIDDVFSDLYNLEYKYASCSAHWMLTHDISLTVHSFNAKYANDIKVLFKKLDPAIRQIIIKEPT